MLLQQSEIRAPGPLNRHDACLLLDGRVLVAGDVRSDVYDPTSGRWERAGDVPGCLRLGPMIPLPDGRVLLCVRPKLEGDRWGPRAALFSPVEHVWRPTRSPVDGPLLGHSASRLLDGRVLFAGGAREDEPTRDTYLFDPQTDEWTEGPPLRHPRTMHHALVLTTGEVLLTGGQGSAEGKRARRAEVFHPDQGVWRSAGVIDSKLEGAETDEGVVFYDGTLWSKESRRTSRREGGFADARRLVRLRDGRIVALSDHRVEVYAADSQEWTAIGSFTDGLSEWATVTELTDGRLLVLGDARVSGHGTSSTGTGRLIRLPPPQPRAPRHSPQAGRILDALRPELRPAAGAPPLEVVLIPLIEEALARESDPRAQAKRLHKALSESTDRLTYGGREWTIWRAIVDK